MTAEPLPAGTDEIGEVAADSADDAVIETAEPAGRDDVPWLRLDARMIAVDLAQTVLSLTPTAVAVWVFGVDASWESLWPLLLAGAFGVLGAVRNALRWAFTRYRVTDEYVERRTGVFVRRYRSVRRDRIRSVDTTARLRHRVAGLRVVLVGAGQQLAAMESALALDAVSRRDADALRAALLAVSPVAEGAEPPAEDVMARFRPWWVVYHVVGGWSFVTAAGLLWGAYGIAATFGVDAAGWLEDLVDRSALGTVGTIAAAVVVTAVVGAVGMGVAFLTTSWGFELARVPGEHGTQLRTRQGLLTTREVNRDDRRLRGVQVSEPVLWRWMGMADTQVLTTGLSILSTSQPATVLPRGPASVAWPVARRVLGADPDPLRATLTPHPRRALRRRLWWATATAVVITAALGWLVVHGVLPAAALWAGGGLWVVGLFGAVVAYRALGHTISGAFLVVRSGFLSRATTALRRDAVSTVALRESVLQRRLGLRTVSLMTAAGYGVYEAPDVAVDEALAFAVDAAPGLLDPFLEPVHQRGDAPST